MSTEEELSGLTPSKGTLLTIGVFDGVHLGHRRLVASLVEQAKAMGLISGVIVFRQHPQSLLGCHPSPPFLTNLPQRIKLLKEEGADVVFPLSFTMDLAQTGVRQFISLLQQQLKMCGLVLGPDATLGRGQEGKIDTLRRLSREIKFSLTVVPHFEVDGEAVSSTGIRQALADGDIKKASRMLGRSYSLEGDVITGTNRGTDLDFPTANLDIEAGRALPQDGVYVTLAYFDNQCHRSVTAIGRRPTFGPEERHVEVHIIGFEGTLYRHQLKIDIIDRLRDIRKFDSVAELKKQIARDIQQAQDMFDNMKC